MNLFAYSFFSTLTSAAFYQNRNIVVLTRFEVEKCTLEIRTKIILFPQHTNTRIK